MIRSDSGEPRRPPRIRWNRSIKGFGGRPLSSLTAKEVIVTAGKPFKTRDVGQIAALFTPDAEWIAPAGNATAVALDHTHHMIGSDQIARFIACEMHRLFFDIDISFRG